MEFKEALKEILKVSGDSALNDKSTIKLLEDFGAFDTYPVFRSILEDIIEMKKGYDIGNIFYSSSIEDKGASWNDLKNVLLEGLPYDEVFINQFFKDLESALISFALEKGTFHRDINTEVEEMLGQVWTDKRGGKYSTDKKRLINASEVEGEYSVLPDTEEICSNAFHRNNKIETITLPKSIKKIGNYAFHGCGNLTNISFDDNIKEIDEFAFGACGSLSEVKLPDGLLTIDKGLFNVCLNLLYVHIPNSVTSIAAYAFNDCHSLQYLVIPDSVTSIGDFAFQWCKSLYYVVLPSKLSSVGEGIFDNCKTLRYIGIPKGTKTKYTNLMPQYASLFVEYSNNVTEDMKETLGHYQGRENVIHRVLDNGVECWFTQERKFVDEAYYTGACKLNTVENEKKHVLFLFDSSDKEVGRYYLGKKLQGKTPEQLLGIKDRLVFFETWNSEQAKWVPCVDIQPSILFTQPSVSISKEQNSLLDNTTNMRPFKEILENYKGKSDVIHLLNSDGESWITQPIKIRQKMRELNAERVIQIESKDKKVHYLCLVDSNNNLLGKYIMDNKLYNKKNDWFSCRDNLDQLEIFDCYVQSSGNWISCVKYNSTNECNYFTIDDLEPIVCGRSGIYLEPIAPDFATREGIINTLPILFKTSTNVRKFLPALDFSSMKSIEQFSKVTMIRTTTGLQFSYGIYMKDIIIGMIFVNTPAFNKTSMGMNEWTLDFFVFAPFEGQGFMRIALPRMMMFLQKNIKVEKFFLLVDKENERCVNLIQQFPIDEIDNSGFKNLESQSNPPLVFECPLSTIRFSQTST